jgi:hypothetical protein
VIEAAGPVDPAGHPGRLKRPGQAVGHLLSLVNYIYDLYSVELPGIELLTSRRGIESRSVEIDPAALLAAVDHGSLELREIRIGVVESIGHGRYARDWIPELLRPGPR